MKNLKRFLFGFVLIGSFAKAQTVFVGSNTNEKLTLKSNSSIHIDGITITPSTDYILADTKISKLATTSNTINSSINRAYYFEKTTTSFTGSIKMAYTDGELNGLNENQLDLALFDGNSWERQTFTNLDTSQNRLTAAVNNKAISEITLNMNEPPLINSIVLATDNTSVSVNFNESVFGNTNGSGDLTATDFDLSITGGIATLSSSIPSSLVSQGDTYVLGIALTGVPNGQELLTISPLANSIYDSRGSVAETTQSSNTVLLNPLNSTPTDIALSSTSIDENVPTGSSVGELSTTDTDSGDTHTYTFVTGTGDTDNASFSISGNNLLTASVLDFETKSSYSIRIQTNDGIASFEKVFTISVVDINEDIDGDGVPNTSDNCPQVANASQLDVDQDGIGDICDSDNDNDNVNDVDDAFPLDPSESVDTDSDGIGDNADQDDDNDGWSDEIEEASGTNPKLATDVPTDTDADGIPDALDSDDDNDGYLDSEDIFPLDSAEWYDNDADGIGDNADQDDDNDAYLDSDEIACESDPQDNDSLPLDFDGDFLADCVDDNDDNDYCLDTEDDFPLDSALCVDTDGDGIDNQVDFDDDNDGTPDYSDDFPRDPTETTDTDGDGIGDNADQDDNNDGFSDVDVIISTVLTPRQSGIESTWKVINIENYPYTRVKVYAPDGSEVYQSLNYQNNWTGINQKTGTPLTTGPYYFRILLGNTSNDVREGWLYIFN